MEISLLVSGVSAVFLTLTGSIAYLFKSNAAKMDAHHADMRQRDDERLRETTELNHKLGMLEGEHRGIKDLSEETLDVVHRAMNRGRGGG